MDERKITLSFSLNLFAFPYIYIHTPAEENDFINSSLTHL